MNFVVILSLILGSISYAKPAAEYRANRWKPTPEEMAFNYCMDRLQTDMLDPAAVAKAQEQAVIRAFGNAIESSIDGPELMKSGRCFWPMNPFKGFLHTYYIGQFNKSLFGGEEPSFFTDMEIDGENQRVQVNCPAALSSKYPIVIDRSEGTLSSAVKRVAAYDKKSFKHLLSAYLKTSLTNANNLEVVSVADDAANPGCLMINTYSDSKERVSEYNTVTRGYGYGRFFRFCADVEKTACGEYSQISEQ